MMTRWLTKFQLLLLLALALAACDKTFPGDNITVIEGVVLDVTTMEPVPFAWVSVNAMSLDAQWGGHGPIATIQADANGRFEYSFESSPDFSYRLRGEGIEDRYVRGLSESISIDEGERNRDLIVKTWPLAWVEIKIYPPEDVVVGRINIQSRETFVNLENDTSFVGRGLGNIQNNISWFVTLHGETTSHNREVYLPAHDTTEFIIEIKE